MAMSPLSPTLTTVKPYHQHVIEFSLTKLILPLSVFIVQIILLVILCVKDRQEKKEAMAEYYKTGVQPGVQLMSDPNNNNTYCSGCNKTVQNAVDYEMGTAG